MANDTYTLTISEFGSALPTSHASTHVGSGADAIRDATPSQNGLMTAAYATKVEAALTAIADNSITTAKILDSNVTLAKLQNIAADILLGRATSGTGVVETIPCTSFGRSLLSQTSTSGQRSVLGLGSMSTQASSSVTITGGSITLSTPLVATSGGTGLSTIAAGSLIVGSTSNTYTTVAGGANGYVLVSTGPTQPPIWQELTTGSVNVTTATGTLPILHGGTGATTPALARTALELGTLSVQSVNNIAVTGGELQGLDQVGFDLTPTTSALSAGQLRWNTEDKTLDLKLQGDVTLQIGQETNLYTYNSEASTILNGKAVYIYSSVGANPAVKLATNAADTALKTLGVATQDINSGEYGYITTQGLVRSLDTSIYSPNTSGTPLWLNSSGGGLTTTEPTHPALRIRIATIVKSGTDGSIYVQPQLFSDGRTAGRFTWGGSNNIVGPTVTLTGLTADSNVIVQERGATTANPRSYSVVCGTNSFTVYADAAPGTASRLFSYIAFI